jgi:hypothetical protein
MMFPGKILFTAFSDWSNDVNAPSAAVNDQMSPPLEDFNPLFFDDF